MHCLFKKVAMFILSLSLVSCATTGDEPLTTNQKIAGCAAMILGGATIGGLLGGDKKSAAIGAAAGGAGCGVWVAFNNQKDKQRIAALQAEAAMTGKSQTDTWTGDDKRSRKVTVSSSTHTELTNGTPQSSQPCRMLNTTATVDDDSQEFSELWCRKTDGSWSPQLDKPVA